MGLDLEEFSHSHLHLSSPSPLSLLPNNECLFFHSSTQSLQFFCTYILFFWYFCPFSVCGSVRARGNLVKRRDIFDEARWSTWIFISIFNIGCLKLTRRLGKQKDTWELFHLYIRSSIFRFVFSKKKKKINLSKCFINALKKQF